MKRRVMYVDIDTCGVKTIETGVAGVSIIEPIENGFVVRYANGDFDTYVGVRHVIQTRHT